MNQHAAGWLVIALTAFVCSAGTGWVCAWAGANTAAWVLSVAFGAFGLVCAVIGIIAAGVSAGRSEG